MEVLHQWALLVVLVLFAIVGLYYLYTLCRGYRCLPLKTTDCPGNKPHHLVYVNDYELGVLAKIAKHTGKPCHGIRSFPVYTREGLNAAGNPATDEQLASVIARRKVRDSEGYRNHHRLPEWDRELQAMVYRRHTPEEVAAKVEMLKQALLDLGRERMLRYHWAVLADPKWGQWRYYNP